MAASRTANSQISERYARALFALADASGQLDAIASELSSLAEAAGTSRELKSLIENPTIARKLKAEAMKTVLAKGNAGKLLVQFVTTLAQNNRLALIGAVSAQFQAMLSAHKGETVVDVTTARHLSENDTNLLTSALGNAVGKAAKVHLAVNPNLLGGVMIKIGSKLLDCSVAGKLRRLEARLQERIAQG